MTAKRNLVELHRRLTSLEEATRSVLRLVAKELEGDDDAIADRGEKIREAVRAARAKDQGHVIRDRVDGVPK